MARENPPPSRCSPDCSRPAPGRIEILGLDLDAHPVEVKRQIGVVPEGMALFGRLTGAEFLSFAGRMYGLDRDTAAKRAAELLDFMQLADQPKKLVTDYSHGMQKKLAMAAAVIHGPKVLFLDEPFEGVDAIAAGTLKSMLQGMIARGATIFLTSHVLEIVERLCSHVAIIHQGRLVAQGSLEELRAGVEAQTPAAGDDAGASGEKLTLEQIFLRIVGGSAPHRAGAFMAGVKRKAQLSPALHRRSQLTAIADLRWRMFVNGLRSRRGKMELVSRIMVTLAFTFGGFGGFAAATGFVLVLRFTR